MRFGHRHWKSRLGDTVCPSVAESPSCPDEYRTNWLKFACSRRVDPANRPPRSPIHPSSVNRTETRTDRKSTRLNSSHSQISYAVFCLKKKKKKKHLTYTTRYQ